MFQLEYIDYFVIYLQGYLDPEYLLTHKLTDKSDVYSLGIVFLELLTAMRPISHGKNIVREVPFFFITPLLFCVPHLIKSLKALDSKNNVSNGNFTILPAQFAERMNAFELSDS